MRAPRPTVLRRAAASVLALSVVAATGGCSVVGTGPSTYRMTAYFAKTPSLYPKARVQVMGANVGTVESIRPENGHVRVEISVRRDVPVPADVHAEIAAIDALGERNVILSPPWRPGMAKAAAGTRIPQERTDLPVEVDDALAAFTKLTRSVDPGQLRKLTKGGADALNGNGADINRTLEATAGLTHDLAGQDQRIVSLATNLRTFAAGLNRKDRDLGGTIDDIAEAGRLLTQERARLQNFLSGMIAMIRKSGVLITAYQETLPSAAADISNIVMSLKANSGSLNQTIGALSRFTKVVISGWDRKNHVAVLRVVLNATVRAWLQPLFDAMGWGRVPCIPDNPALANCPKTRGSK
ncbi:MCE family protein [Actinomadura barringtoniae]|uniref:MCE family protein n=1 Tax=Actinomadura barringtoniae TaxID=1427535 RepID=A0A939PCL7_9ACTN|nr:MCE family protein [Actinomadura barringtoniae]MBO2447588.1 MCE family protein [Actinomadura barringtoniae]